MAGIVSPGIARDHAEIFRENVDNLAFALVTPLGADYDRGLAFTHRLLHDCKCSAESLVARNCDAQARGAAENAADSVHRHPHG